MRIAVAYNDGKEIGRSAIVTADQTAKLAVCLTRETLPADGSGISFLIIDALDSQGRVNRQDHRAVSMTVEGAGILAGFGSADPSSENSYQNTTCNMFDGRVMAAIRSADHPGVIQVSVTAEGCPEEKISIPVR